MKFLFATFHPVDPQIVRFLSYDLISKGHEILFTVVEKEGIISSIIKSYGFNVKQIGKARRTIFGKILNVITIDINLFWVCIKFKPELIFSPASPYTGHIAKLLHIPHIGWGDTETATLNLRSSLPFIDCLLLPDCFYSLVSSNKIVRFNSYKEIAYLHPRYFKQDPSILNLLGIKENEKIILMRFSALNATHDIGLTSKVKTNNDRILSGVIELSTYARVFISCTERDLGPEFDDFKLNIHPSEYTNFLSYCSIYIGEGTTTASESGVLGVPWINIQAAKRGYLIDQEQNYDLGFRTDNLEVAFNTAKIWIQQKDLKEKWALKSKKLLDAKIDFTQFLVWFLEYYPDSFNIMKNNPAYQNKFK